MQVHKGFDHLPTFSHGVATIGSFDGVHHGHRAIIQRLIDRAQQTGGESILMTFDPHPRQVVTPHDQSLRLLNSLDEKIALLKETGLDHLIVIPFTVEFSQIDPDVYVQDILQKKIGVKELIIGYDHKFGLNRKGDINLLKTHISEDFQVVEIAQQAIDDNKVSSTVIRKELAKGNIDRANHLLGSTYTVTGTIVKGSQIARDLGYHTANCKVQFAQKLLPKAGTYAASAMVADQDYTGMLYIGKSPTLKGLSKETVEMHLYTDEHLDLYDQEITIYIEKRIRGDQKFEDRKELIFNINKDDVACRIHHDAKHNKSKVTIAILNYNGRHHLASYLPSYALKEDQELVVIDNASTDDSVAFLKEHYPDIRIIETPENLGFTGGYNFGLQQIHSPYTMIINSDVRVTQGWLEPLIKVLEKDVTVAAVQPTIRSVQEPTKFEYAGAAGGYIDRLGYPFCRGRVLDTVEEDQGQYNQETSCFWASGAAMLIRTDLYKKMGGLDDDFFAHMEEIDLCWRMKSMGYTIKQTPAATVYHLGGGTLSYDSPQKVYLNMRNNYWMLLKNATKSSLLTALPMRLMIDTAYALTFLLKGHVRHFMSVLRGIWSGLFSFSKIRKERQQIRYLKNRYTIQQANGKGRLKMILPLSYYILGKKTFGQLS